MFINPTRRTIETIVGINSGFSFWHQWWLKMLYEYRHRKFELQIRFQQWGVVRLLTMGGSETVGPEAQCLKEYIQRFITKAVGNWLEFPFALAKLFRGSGGRRNTLKFHWLTPPGLNSTRVPLKNLGFCSTL